MPALWVPQSYAAAEQLQNVEAASGRWRWFERELCAIDENLRLVFVYPARGELLPPEQVAHRWHVVRVNPNPSVEPSFWPILGVDGAYREPDNLALEALRRGDMWRAGHRAELEQAQYRREREAEKAEAERSAERVDEWTTHIRAGSGVSMAKGWTRSKKGKRSRVKGLVGT